MEEAQWNLSEKERQVSKLQEQEKALHATFSEAVGENNKFKDFLMKVRLEGPWPNWSDLFISFDFSRQVFTKKIKRVKKKVVEKRNEEGGEEEDMSDEDSDSDLR